MKKRILPILVIIISLVTLFTVSASASTYGSYPTVPTSLTTDLYTNPEVIVFKDTDGNYRLWVNGLASSQGYAFAVVSYTGSSTSVSVKDKGYSSTYHTFTKGVKYLTSIFSSAPSTAYGKGYVWSDSSSSWTSTGNTYFYDVTGLTMCYDSQAIPYYEFDDTNTLPTAATALSSISDFFTVPPVQIVPQILSGTGGTLSAAVSQNSSTILPVALILLAVLLGVSLIPRVISLFR